MALNLLKIVVVILILTQLACGKKEETSGADIQETGQQVGDVMDSIDESVASISASITSNEEHDHLKLLNRIEDKFLPHVTPQPLSLSGTCAYPGTWFTSCSASERVRTFNSCTIGGSILSGEVKLTYDNGTCSMASVGNDVTRAPNFTMSGRRGGSLTVSVPNGSTGQNLEKTGTDTFKFTNDGIRRVISSGSRTLYDFTTETANSGHITITGASRSSRTLSSTTGLLVTNNSNGNQCTFIPSGVTWTSTCNCATSGTWNVSCTQGGSGSLAITGCGSATLTIGEDTEDLTFDRCYSL